MAFGIAGLNKLRAGGALMYVSIILLFGCVYVMARAMPDSDDKTKANWLLLSSIVAAVGSVIAMIMGSTAWRGKQVGFSGLTGRRL